MDENEEGRRKWEEEGVIGHIVPISLRAKRLEGSLAGEWETGPTWEVLKTWKEGGKTLETAEGSSVHREDLRIRSTLSPDLS